MECPFAGKCFVADFSPAENLDLDEQQRVEQMGYFDGLREIISIHLGDALPSLLGLTSCGSE